MFLFAVSYVSSSFSLSFCLLSVCRSSVDSDFERSSVVIPIIHLYFSFSLFLCLFCFYFDYMRDDEKFDVIDKWVLFLLSLN